MMVSSDPKVILETVQDLTKREADLLAELTMVRKELRVAKKALLDCKVATLVALKDASSESESEGSDKPTESESEPDELDKGDAEEEFMPEVAEQPALPPPTDDIIAPGGAELAVCGPDPPTPPRPSPVAPVSKAGACVPSASIFSPVPAPSPPVPNPPLNCIVDAASVAKAPSVVEAIAPKAKGRPCKRNAPLAIDGAVPVKKPRGRPSKDPNGPCLACKYRNDGTPGGKGHNYGILCERHGRKPPAPKAAVVPAVLPALPAPVVDPPAAKAAGAACSDTSSNTSSSSESD